MPSHATASPYYHFAPPKVEPKWEFRIRKANNEWSLWYACKPSRVEQMRTEPGVELRRIEK